MESALNPERGILDVYCHPNVVFQEAEASRSECEASPICIVSSRPVRATQ